MRKNELFIDNINKITENVKHIDQSDNLCNKYEDDKERFGVKDFIAVCIAVFEIVMPIVLIGLLILAIILLLFTKLLFR